MPGGDELSENNATLHNVFFQEGLFIEENKDNYDFASRQTQRTSSKQETELVVPGYWIPIVSRNDSAQLFLWEVTPCSVFFFDWSRQYYYKVVWGATSHRNLIPYVTFHQFLIYRSYLLNEISSCLSCLNIVWTPMYRSINPEAGMLFRPFLKTTSLILRSATTIFTTPAFLGTPLRKRTPETPSPTVCIHPPEAPSAVFQIWQKPLWRSFKDHFFYHTRLLHRSNKNDIKDRSCRFLSVVWRPYAMESTLPLYCFGRRNRRGGLFPSHPY